MINIQLCKFQLGHIWILQKCFNLFFLSLPLPRSQYLKDWNRFRVRTAIGREGGALLKPLPCTRENSMKLCPPPISSPINQTVDLSLLVIRALELFSSSQSKRAQKGLAFSLGKTNLFSLYPKRRPSTESEKSDLRLWGNELRRNYTGARERAKFSLKAKSVDSLVFSVSNEFSQKSRERPYGTNRNGGGSQLFFSQISHFKYAVFSCFAW